MKHVNGEPWNPLADSQEDGIVKLVIDGQLLDLNEYTYLNRKGIGAGSTSKRMQERKIRADIMRQLEGIPMMRRVVVKFIWFASSERKDPDNVSFAKKFILDALVKEHIMENDGWKNIAGLIDEFRIDRINPRIEVYITAEVE